MAYTIEDFPQDYSGKDYESYLAKAEQIIKLHLPEWDYQNDNDINKITIKAVAYLLSISQGYIDLSFFESHPATATSYANLIRYANESSVPVKSPAGASTDLVVYNRNTLEEDLLIPKGTTFKSEQGDIFSSIHEVSLAKEENSSIKVSVLYGSYFSEVLGTSNGEPYQYFETNTELIQGHTVEVTTVSSENVETSWSVVDFMYTQTTANVCRVNFLGEFKFEVIFGDGVNGNIPSKNDSIRIKGLTLPLDYLSKRYGNMDAGLITTTSLGAISEVTQPNEASGGEGSEDIETLRKAVLNYSRLGGRLVSTEDYKLVVKNISGVYSLKVSSSPDLISLYIVPTEGSTVSEELRQRILSKIYLNRLAGIDIHIIDPEKLQIDIVLDVSITEGSDWAVVQNDLKNKIETYIKESSSSDVLAIKDIYKIILSVKELSLGRLSKFKKTSTSQGDFEDIYLQISQVPVLNSLQITKENSQGA